MTHCVGNMCQHTQVLCVHPELPRDDPTAIHTHLTSFPSWSRSKYDDNLAAARHPSGQTRGGQKHNTRNATFTSYFEFKWTFFARCKGESYFWSYFSQMIRFYSHLQPLSNSSFSKATHLWSWNEASALTISIWRGGGEGGTWQHTKQDSRRGRSSNLGSYWAGRLPMYQLMAPYNHPIQAGFIHPLQGGFIVQVSALETHMSQTFWKTVTSCHSLCTLTVLLVVFALSGVPLWEKA